MKNRYLRPAVSMPRIYLHRDPVDFRKSYRGLAAIVEQELGHNPFDGGLYAFINQQRNKIKLLMCEDDGFVLYYKALAEEKFRWPRPEDDVMPLTSEQLNWLLDGYDISLMKGSWLAIWVDRRVWLILVEELCRFTGEKLLVR